MSSTSACVTESAGENLDSCIRAGNSSMLSDTRSGDVLGI